MTQLLLGSAETEGDLTWIWLGILFLFSFGLYFLPSIIAGGRRKRNQWAIFVVNLFLGWTFVGWIVALVWSAAYEENPLPRRRSRWQWVRRTPKPPPLPPDD